MIIRNTHKDIKTLCPTNQTLQENTSIPECNAARTPEYVNKYEQ